ncbi:MAG: ATP-binding cassette domain-containing protein [Verrucomicrobia bacterium]|nr:ATP-binding cassette domain-containing protein [Verrucomicrobiota bacterium]
MPAPTQPLLQMSGIDKHFSGIAALSSASLNVGRGEVHALIGQNGAGKSTLIKILTGYYTKDAGEILFDGQPFAVHSPNAAQANGISTIYQEINLIPYRSVAENIFLGREHRRFGLLDWRRMASEAEELLLRFNLKIDVHQPLSHYSTAIQQMVAIARAVSFQARLVIMDEPTSSLDDHEVAVLFEVIQQLKSSGVSVIFVSHKLDELYVVCERVTVMRDGRTVLSGSLGSLSKLDLVTTMIGRALDSATGEQTGFRPGSDTAPMEESEPLLRVRNLSVGRKVASASLDLQPGEIVGLAGLLGSGRSEIARTIFGAESASAGEMIYQGTAFAPKSPANAISSGIGFCTEDRKMDGIVPEMSVRENLTLALLPHLARAGIVNEEAQRLVVAKFIKTLQIKCSSPEQPIRELSGGNQQKVLLARWLCLNPKLLILDEPTRGIDVGAKREIQNLISELATGGLGVLMISSEMEELVEGSDRVFVLREGRTVAEFNEHPISEDAIMAAMADGISALKSTAPTPTSVAAVTRGNAIQVLNGASPMAASPPEAKPLLPSDQSPAQIPAETKTGRLGNWAERMRRQGVLIALLALIGFNLAFTPHFLSWQTFNVNLTQVCNIVIVGVGMTLVIGTGGIDLSVGSLMAIAGAIAPIIFQNKIVSLPAALGIGLAFVVPVLVAGAFGWFNGWLITRFRIQPIVATLILFIAGRGIAQVSTNGNLQAFNAPAFQVIGLGRPFGVPVQALIMFFFVAVAAWMLRFTIFGRELLATGGNEEAARLAGVPVNRIKRVVYAISGLCAGMAGLIVIAINSSSDANLVGLGMELDAIAAVSVGGTPFTGGRASVLGTLVGALIIQLVRYTLLANGIPDAAALVVKASIILGAVFIQAKGRSR